MIEIIYYVHGSTLDNETHIATGWEQEPLSPKGIRQTEKMAEEIDSREFELIYTSDLLRAIQSTEIIFSNCKKKIITDWRLRECNYGDFTKKSSSILQYDKHINNPFPNGECLHDVEIRIRKFLSELELKKLSKIAIVSHRIPQLALDVIVSGLSWEEAIKRDWRICENWQPGWYYLYQEDNL